MASFEGLRFSFPEVGVAATAELLSAMAPQTVTGVLGAVPLTGLCNHAIYSGSEIAFMIPASVWLPTENASVHVVPGDLAYFKFEGGRHYGFPDDTAELCWFYDRDAVPSMPEGPVAVNIFGRFTEGWENFAAACRAMRTEGARQLTVDRV